MACKLFFAGDVVLGENCFEKKLLNKDFYNVIQDCDIICCNLEAPLKGENGKAIKKIGPNNFIPYLEIGGFSHRWPPLDVLRHEQPEVLNFGDCERLSSFCHHFSDRLKQFITLNPVVLPCGGEE